jgi:hypothetical protein
MEKSPNIDPSQADKTDQQIVTNNVPKSGKRSDQGAAPTMKPWDNS